MRTNLWSAFTLAMITMIVVGMVHNNEAGATPPKENPSATKALEKQLVSTNVLQSKLAAAMANQGTKFILGGDTKNMGFRGTGGGGGGDKGFARTHGLNKLEKSSKIKPVKARKKTKAVKAPQALPCSQTIQVYEEPAMTLLE